MRYIRVPALDREVSVLGFGCASLGSRVSNAQGCRALAAALEQGINWYDVAPAYGDGRAEELLGAFLRDRGEDVVVSTKVGLHSMGRRRVLEWVKPAARAAVRTVPKLRGLLHTRNTANTKLPITAELIKFSAAKSLERLGRAWLDVLLLHDPTPQECCDPSVLGALHELLDSGLVRAVGIGGAAESVVAGVSASAAYQVAQVSISPLSGDFKELDDGLRRAIFRVGHGAFGVAGALDKLTRQLQNDAVFRNQLASIGYGGQCHHVARAVLSDYAFTRNSGGVVLCSMFDDRHLAENCERAGKTVSPSVAATLKKVLEANP